MLEQLLQGHICLERHVLPGEHACVCLVLKGDAVVGHDEVFELIVGYHAVSVPVHESLEDLGLSLREVAAM